MLLHCYPSSFCIKGAQTRGKSWKSAGWWDGTVCLSVCRRGLERTEGFWVGGGWKPVSGFAPDRVIWESPSLRGMRFSSVWAVSFALLVVSWALSSFHCQSVRIACEFHIWTRKQVHFSWAKPDTRCWDKQILIWSDSRHVTLTFSKLRTLY